MGPSWGDERPYEQTREFLNLERARMGSQCLASVADANLLTRVRHLALGKTSKQD